MDKYRLDGHKLYWHLDRVLAWQNQETIPPIYLEMSPVSYCNHQCIFCGKDFVRVERHSLDLDLTCRRLREMGELGVRSIMWAGEGEPLLHPGLEQMVATAKGAGIDVSITTNGALGNRERWAAMLPHLTWLRFSMDAARDATYSRVHGVKSGSLERTLASLQAALDLRRQRELGVTIGVQFLVLEENLEDIAPALELYSRMGVDYLALKPFSRNPRMLGDKDQDYQDQTIEKVAALVKAHGQEGPTKVVFRAESMRKYKDKERPFQHCHALPFWGYICASGDFYTCAIFIGDQRFRVGNINQEDMAHILHGPARQASVRLGASELAVEGECRFNCRMARVNEFLDTLVQTPAHVNFI